MQKDDVQNTTGLYLSNRVTKAPFGKLQKSTRIIDYYFPTILRRSTCRLKPRLFTWAQPVIIFPIHFSFNALDTTNAYRHDHASRKLS